MAVETLPIQSYLAANERARLLLLSAQAHDRAGRTMRAIADINAAADIEVEAGRAKRLLRSFPLTVSERMSIQGERLAAQHRR